MSNVHYLHDVVIGLLAEIMHIVFDMQIYAQKIKSCRNQCNQAALEANAYEIWMKSEA